MHQSFVTAKTVTSFKTLDVHIIHHIYINSRSRRDVMSHVIYLTTRPPLLFGGKSSDKLSMKRNQ